jgi:D-xylose transport system permease protein
MSVTEPTQVATDAAPAVTAAVPRSLGEAWQSYWRNVRSGEIGSLPAVIAIIVLFIFFGVAQSGFSSMSNVDSIINEGAPTVFLAMGLIFVLLLGEIDLSAGVVGSSAACLGAVLSVKHGVAWPLAILGAAAFGAVAGVVLGWLRARIGIPSFVVTLAAFIAFQGVQILVLGSNTGVLSITDKTLLNLDNGRMAPALGWVFLVVLVALYAVVKFIQRFGRIRGGLRAEPLVLLLIRIGALLVGGAVAVYLFNKDQALSWQSREGLHIWGVPYIVIVIIGFLAVLGFVLGKTRYGRHIYAVGGSDEAARRAGIPTVMVRLSVFVICSAMAGFSGIVLASQNNGVSTQQGGGNTLLLAVAAAVIGGTSLMGGRGRILDAVLGGAALAILQNGMSDLIKSGNSAAWKLIVEGIVLLLAAAVDALSRRSGRTSS